MGHIISTNGLEKDPLKIEAILKLPEPTNVDDLRSFLGIVMFYINFIPNASTTLHPVHQLKSLQSKMNEAVKAASAKG